MTEVAQRLRTANSFLLSTHARIDGDGIGSVLALSAVLAQLSKRHLALLPDVVPQVYRFLPGADRAVIAPPNSPVEVPEDVDTVVLLDAPEMNRMESAYQHVPKDAYVIKIDHHQPVDHKADLELVDPAASSTSEIVLRLLSDQKFPIGPEAAVNLYVGIITDTGRFTLPNTTPGALRACAQLLEIGVNAGQVGEELYRNYPPEVMALEADLVGSLRYEQAGQIAVGVLTQEMLNRHQVHPADTQDFSDIPRSIRGVKVGVLLRERPRNLGFRVSLRSAEVPIRSVARDLGGGGHELASGCNVPGPLEEAIRNVVDRIRPLLSPKGNGAR